MPARTGAMRVDVTNAAGLLLVTMPIAVRCPGNEVMRAAGPRSVEFAVRDGPVRRTPGRR